MNTENPPLLRRIGTAVPEDRGAAFVAPGSVLAGAVRLEQDASVWYGAVLRADTGRITVGAGSNVQDGAVVHTGPGLDVVIGPGVSIGHGAVVHGCRIGAHCLIGMHATVMNGADIGPKILGQKVGVSALWVLFSIVLGGDLLGIVGMVIGVPVFATLYGLGQEVIHWMLERRGINAEGKPLSAETEES